MTFTPSPEQHAVINYPLEPLRVVAGAGTGKTTTIVHRLAALVAAGISPESAIGITFTNKAAEELAGRLRDVLPVLAAEGREVEVTTYHGFAYSVLQEFGAMIGVERDSDVIGPGYARQLLQEAIGDGTYRHLDLTSIPSRVDQSLALASQLARNLRAPSDMLDLEPFDDVSARRTELASIIKRYEAYKRELSVLDYGDLIFLAHRLLSEHVAVASRLRERYSVALLDEYQDTDPAQRELLRLVFGNGFPVTAVGDADQTIYEWRGASAENFTGFPRHFPRRDGSPAATLHLTENRRSSERILGAAHEVRKVIYEDHAIDPLTPIAGAPPGRVSADFFRTSVDEAEWIAGEIARLNEEENVSWRDVAVVFRKNRDMILVRDALQAQGIPVEVGSLGGLLDLPDIADLHAWLRTIERPGDSIALGRLLLGSRYRLGFADLAALTRWIKPNRALLGDDPEAGWPLVEAIDQLEVIDGLNPAARSRLMQFRDLYRQFLELAQGTSLVDLCRSILDATDTWNEVEAREPAAALTARVNLYRFLDLAEEWSPLRDRPTLAAFLGYLDLLADEGAATELDTANVGTEDAVVLLTVHRAKGLEWDAVFVPTLTKDVFPYKGGRLDDPSHLADVVPYELRLESPVPPELDGDDRRAALARVRNRQEWRTAYVAMTRAKNRLYLTGAHWIGNAGNPRPPSPVFEAAVRSPGIDLNHHVDDPGERPTSLSIVSNVGAPDPILPDGWRQALRKTIADPQWPLTLIDGDDATYHAAVEQIRMILDDMPAPATETPGIADVDTSVTGLVTLATCPQRFYWSEIDPLPRRRTIGMQRGIQVHRLIELHGRGEMPLEDLADDLYDLADGDSSVRGGPDPYQIYLESRFAALRPRFVETPIDLRLPSGRVRGRIDAVYETEPGTWEIVDFKSGSRREDDSAVVQLEAYAVAAADGALSPVPPQHLAVTFAYLGGGMLEEVSVAVDDGWIDHAREHLADLAATATGPQFAPTPSAACRTCDFIRFCEAGSEYVSNH